MVTALDIAAYVLEKQGQMTAMKLQKLVYYCQAWSLVWDEKPMFRDVIEAWANGPVVPNLYRAHRGLFIVKPSDIKGDSSKLSVKAKETADIVLKFYGDKPASWLSELTHRESPWKDARKGMKPGERGSVQICHAAMSEYYNSLL
jgi:uncharacterized phage-associated protein